MERSRQTAPKQLQSVVAEKTESEKEKDTREQARQRQKRHRQKLDIILNKELKELAKYLDVAIREHGGRYTPPDTENRFHRILYGALVHLKCLDDRIVKHIQRPPFRYAFGYYSA